ncbi:hypothetical protein Dpoa2040_001414 [Dickeya sp. CFBP 2040]|uniref:hypothetical protein n=1 Tax=Dickeya sp. CFBP 2040 TaxID=2718531 RepID=UPI0014484D69|nr:hypothetical protein [Dickeya sp. CFBP 2040]NKI74177.1 hypothetical protein [Dickeya sp. CFBP 2040]
MDFWIVIGITAAVIYLVNQRKTKITDETVIQRIETIKTNTGEIRIDRAQTIKHEHTEYAPPYEKTAPLAPIPVVIEDNTERRSTLSQLEDEFARKIEIASPKITIAHPMRPTRTVSKPITQNSVTTANTSSESSANAGKKICPRCSRNLAYGKFRKSSKHEGGYTTWCDECLSAPRNTRHMKYCPKCKKRKMKTSFYKNGNRADGFTLWCKNCMDNS